MTFCKHIGFVKKREIKLSACMRAGSLREAPAKCVRLGRYVYVGYNLKTEATKFRPSIQAYKFNVQSVDSSLLTVFSLDMHCAAHPIIIIIIIIAFIWSSCLYVHIHSMAPYTKSFGKQLAF